MAAEDDRRIRLGAAPVVLNTIVHFSMPGWTEEEAPRRDLRIWRDLEGDVLSLGAPAGSLGLKPLANPVRLRQWCREVAETRGAGLIEVRANSGTLGETASLIYKRLEIPAYIFTGMLFLPRDGFFYVWTVVSRERGTTGIREAAVTSQLMNAGQLTVEEYKRSWAQDPYDPEYRGVDRTALRFVSDNEAYDEQFPHHPLSKVRRILAALPTAVRIEAEPTR